MTKFIVIFTALLASTLLIWWVLFLNHIPLNSVGVAYDSYKGTITVQSNAGWYITSPLTTVEVLSTLPQSVKIPTDANIIETKIVKLKADKVIDFIKMQGFSWSDSQNINNILMGYAFSGKSWSFLEIVQDSNSSTNN